MSRDIRYFIEPIKYVYYIYIGTFEVNNPADRAKPTSSEKDRERLKQFAER
jgi:hypothetical protein